MNTQTNLSVVIDIGSSKLVAIAGRKNEDGKPEITGIVQIPSGGIKRGVIVNIDEFSNSLKELKNLLESKIETNITKADIAYAGQQIKTAEYKGYRIAAEDNIVNKTDILELYNEARNLRTNQEYRILEIIPQTFTVDGESVGLKPIGSCGKKIEALFKILLMPESQYNTLKKAFDRVEIEMGEITFSPIATAEAVLSPEEKEMGAILLDIGSGTTKIAIFYDSVLMYSSVIPFGGNVITNDIKEGCSIHSKWAELLKVKYGGAIGDMADEQKFVTIPAQPGWEKKEISTKSLAYIIQARVEEIIDIVYLQIEKSGIIDKLGCGIVVSGGTAQLKDIVQLIKFKTGLDAHLAYQRIFGSGKNNGFDDYGIVTALGLFKLTLKKTMNQQIAQIENKEAKKKEPGSWKKAIQKILNFVDDDNRDLPLND